MLRIAEHRLPYEVREAAGFVVCKGAGIAHQDQLMGVKGLRNEGWMYS